MGGGISPSGDALASILQRTKVLLREAELDPYEAEALWACAEELCRHVREAPGDSAVWAAAQRILRRFADDSGNDVGRALGARLRLGEICAGAGRTREAEDYFIGVRRLGRTLTNEERAALGSVFDEAMQTAMYAVVGLYDTAYDAGRPGLQRLLAKAAGDAELTDLVRARLGELDEYVNRVLDGYAMEFLSDDTLEF
ncbi:MAG: hypothetical protein JXR94_16265 [Candidatus Hydrogenedentes bacterium]|nr:hypothetical protein [Candidatus Hydrogenedentota bacterium]